MAVAVVVGPAGSIAPVVGSSATAAGNPVHTKAPPNTADHQSTAEGRHTADRRTAVFDGKGAAARTLVPAAVHLPIHLLGMSPPSHTQEVEE